MGSFDFGISMAKGFHVESQNTIKGVEQYIKDHRQRWKTNQRKTRVVCMSITLNVCQFRKICGRLSLSHSIPTIRLIASGLLHDSLLRASALVAQAAMDIFEAYICSVLGSLLLAWHNVEDDTIEYPGNLFAINWRHWRYWQGRKRMGKANRRLVQAESSTEEVSLLDMYPLNAFTLVVDICLGTKPSLKHTSDVRGCCELVPSALVTHRTTTIHHRTLDQPFLPTMQTYSFPSSSRWPRLCYRGWSI